MGTAYILSNLAALLADTYIGRFKTVVFAGSLEFLGLALLALQAHHPKPPVCKIFDPASRREKIDGANAALLFVGLYMLAAGSASVKAALPSHGADQFDEKDPKEARQMSSFFNGLLLAVCVGGAISLTLIMWIQGNKGWDWGFGISPSPCSWLIQVIQGNSPITEIIQVHVAAIRNRNLHLPEDPADLYEIENDKEAAVEAEFLPHRDIFRFLDKAAVQPTSTGQDSRPEAPNPWKLCRVTQVENAKVILGMIPIFCCTIIMTLCLAQLQTFSIQQGRTMDTSFTKSLNIPPASLPIIPVVFMIVIIPAYDRIFVPFALKTTGITHLQRIGVGLILSSISMAVAGIMEVKRKDVARDSNMLDAIPVKEPLPISTFWPLSFQFFIFGIADLFTYVGLLEFFYSEAPKGVKSISTCFLWSSMALGYFLSTIVVNIVNSEAKDITRSGGQLAGDNINGNHLNLFYWLLSILSLINFSSYLVVAKRYKYRLDSPMHAVSN
ncbi:hypothetical protein I3843_10G093800 [Carya illinoinensis]|nr:hypothetical protein I3843_10G093800 [Carya illinoinensis]